MARAQAKVTTDHEEIRRWAEERGAVPARVRGTGGKGDVGMLRLDFPGYSGEESLEPISWDDWFRKFDESGLALLHQDQTAQGVKSNFNKLISRQAASSRKSSASASKRVRAAASRTSKTRTARRSAAGSQTRRRASNRSTAKSARGSTRSKRTESARGRTTSRRKAA